MRTSETIDKIAPALVKAQQAMEAAAKDKTNPHFKSKYSDLATVIEAVKKPLNDNGIMFIQSPRLTTREPLGVVVETMLLHSSGQWLADDLELPATQATPQACGSAITYAKRYGLQSICGLPSEDDDGNAASAQTERKDSARAVTTEAFDELPDEAKDFIRSHATAVSKIHATRGDIVGYLAEQNFDQESKLALWSQLPSNVRSWVKDQEKIARANAIGKAMAPLAAQP